MRVKGKGLWPDFCENEKCVFGHCKCGSSDKDVERRILVRTKVAGEIRTFISEKEITTKIKLYKTVLTPVTLCGSVTWALTSKQ